VSALSRIVGRTLGEIDIRQATGATVLAILREGTPLVNPGSDLVLASGDRLLALGTGDQLERLERLIGGA
jgi:TrkA domain protein